MIVGNTQLLPKLDWQTRNLGEAAFVARDQLKPVRDGRRSDHEVVSAYRNPFCRELRPELGVNSCRNQIKGKYRPSFEQQFDESLPPSGSGP